MDSSTESLQTPDARSPFWKAGLAQFAQARSLGLNSQGHTKVGVLMTMAGGLAAGFSSDGAQIAVGSLSTTLPNAFSLSLIAAGVGALWLARHQRDLAIRAISAAVVRTSEALRQRAPRSQPERFQFADTAAHLAHDEKADPFFRLVGDYLAATEFGQTPTFRVDRRDWSATPTTTPQQQASANASKRRGPRS
jgi:hypothetical protein